MTGTSRRDFYLYQRLKDERGSDLVVAPRRPARRSRACRFRSGVRCATARDASSVSSPRPSSRGGCGHSTRPSTSDGMGRSSCTTRMGNSFSTPAVGWSGCPPAGKPFPGGPLAARIVASCARLSIRAANLPATAWHRLRQPPLVIAVSIAKADALSFWSSRSPSCSAPSC